MMLISDLHIGSSHFSESALRFDLDKARDNNWPILINGDVLDMILWQDRKRFSVDAIDPELRHRSDLITAGIDKAEKILAEYAPLIELLGQGNHETAVCKYHSVDPTSILLDRLRKHGCNASHGGYAGYYVIKMVNSYNGKRCGSWSWKLRYHHGVGGNAAVTKGLIQVNRMLTWCADADCIWMGHLHNRVLDNGILRERMDDYGNVKYDNCAFVFTGAYLTPSPDNPGGWAVEKNFSPQQTGGAEVTVRFYKQDVYSKGKRQTVFKTKTRVTL